jgi:hypothetical protein
MSADWRIPTGLAGVLAGGALFAVAYSIPSAHLSTTRLVFWVAVIVVVVSFGLALSARRTTPVQLVALCGAVAAVLYIPKLGRSPDEFIFFDELQHVRSTSDLLDGIQLFVKNPVNPLATHYPGLSTVTALLASASGLSLFAAGNVLILAARVLMLISLFVLYRRLLGGPRVAALGVLLYAANPAFFYFDAQFSYESLALPLAIAVFTLAFTPPFEGPANRWLIGLCAALIPAIVVTHHVTAYTFAGLFVVFAAGLRLLEPDNRVLARRLAILGAVTVAITTLWWGFVASDTWRYVSKDIGSNLSAVPEFITGDTGARTPFAGSVFPLPTYEIWSSYLGLLLVALAFVGGAVLGLRDEPEKRGRYAACILVGCGYFATLPLQLLQESGAAPIAPRIWEVSFIGLAPIAALALRRLALVRRPLTTAAAGLAVVFMLASGIVIRSGDNIRFAGPYVASSGPRSTTPDTIAAARWLARNYGSGRVVMGDFTLASIFGGYADSQPATYQNYGVRPWRVFFSNKLTGAGRFELDRSGTEFVAVDRRMTTGVPFTNFYFSSAEPKHSWRHLPKSYLAKFDSDPEFERVYDNGNVVIYHYLRPSS